MGGFGKLALGLAKGLGGYYEKVAEREEKSKLLEVATQREMALARFRTGEAKDLATHQGEIARQNTKAELGVRGELAEADDTRTAAARIEQMKLEFRQKWDLMTEEQRLGMSREQYVQSQLNARQGAEISSRKALQEDDQAHDAATRPIATMTNARGEVTQAFGNRNVRTYNDSRPTARSEDDDYSGPSRVAPTGGSAAPTPSTSEIDTIVAGMKQDPAYRGMSDEELRRRARIVVGRK